MSRALTFRRNSGGNLFARGKNGTGLTVFKMVDGRWQWRIWHHRGKLTISEQSFPTENSALDDLTDTLAVASVLDDL